MLVEPDIRRLLSPEELQEFKRLEPWRSVLGVAVQWALIIGAATVSYQAFQRAPLWASLLLYLLTVAFIGARMHTLIIVYMHDGAHQRLFKSRRLNEVFAELFTAWPFVLFSMRTYRKNHFAHHAHLNTDDDPDWVRKSSWIYPTSARAFARLLAYYLLMGGFIRFLVAARALIRAPEKPEDVRFLVGKVLWLVVLSAGITALGWWDAVLLYWFIPFATWFQLAFNLRSMADHSHIPGAAGGQYGMSRTITVSPLERAFFLGGAPGFYHLAHHLDAKVPCYKLEAFHGRLMEDPDFRARSHETRGFSGFVKECMAVGQSS